MRSKITTKYQTTIPREIRRRMNLSAHDILEWTVENGRVVVTPGEKPFLKFLNAIRVGPGDILADVTAARDAMAKEGR
jgi:AbrB family looped-hinge helix DNA binding protein